MWIRIVSVLLVAVVALVSACSTETAGNAIADQLSGIKSTTKLNNQTLSNSKHKLQPCNLLSPEEGAKLIGELTVEPYYERIVTAHTCVFKSRMIISRVVVRYTRTLSDMKAANNGALEIVINGRRGIQIDAGTCGVVLEIISGGSFEATTTHQNENEACATSLKIAEFTEPRLPR